MSSVFRVLLAEDHPLLRDVLTSLLSAHCLVVGTVSRGDHVLLTLENTRLDALVLDISLPGQSGLQLLPAVRSAFPELAVIIVTNHDARLYREEALQRGADGYVLKGRAAADLWPALEAAVLYRRSHRPALSASL